MRSSQDAGTGRCKIVGEVGLTHDGSLGVAHAFIDAIAATGADAVKFQTHIAEAESTIDEPFRIPFSRQDASRYEYWQRTSFAESEWAGLAEHARSVGMEFLSSPFSVQAVEWLERAGMETWKIASGEITNSQLLDRIVQTGQHVILSTGMSPLEDVDLAVAAVRQAGCELTVMQCTTEYPCPPEHVGLNLLAELRERYRCPVGLSDHSGTIFPGLAAATLGATLIEVHVTLSREMFGPDVPASLTTAQLAELVLGVRSIERMLASPIDKQAMAADKAPMRALFYKSVALHQDLPAGTVLSQEHLTGKKPGSGIPIRRMHEFVGRRLLRDVAANRLLSEEDVE